MGRDDLSHRDHDQNDHQIRRLQIDHRPVRVGCDDLSHRGHDQNGHRHGDAVEAGGKNLQAHEDRSFRHRPDLIAVIAPQDPESPPAREHCLHSYRIFAMTAAIGLRGVVFRPVMAAYTRDQNRWIHLLPQQLQK